MYTPDYGASTPFARFHTMLSDMIVQHDTQAYEQQNLHSMRAQVAARGAPLLWEPWPLQAPSALKVVVAGSALLDALQGESAR